MSVSVPVQQFGLEEPPAQVGNIVKPAPVESARGQITALPFPTITMRRGFFIIQAYSVFDNLIRALGAIVGHE